MTLLRQIHSLWRWVVLLGLAAPGGLGALQTLRKGGWSASLDGLARWAPLAVDLQVFLGILLWLGHGYWQGGNSFFRLLHPLLALAALGMTHAFAGLARRRRNPRFLALLLILPLPVVLILIPWGR